MAEVTKNGNAVIARLNIADGHFVVVDGITNRLGQSVVAIRDPGSGRQYSLTRSEFESKFSGQVVYSGGRP